MLNSLIKFINLILFVLFALIFILDNKSFIGLHNFLYSNFNSTSSNEMAATTNQANSSNLTIDSLASVDIDEMGRFKYIMVKVLDPRQNKTKIIVRGFQWAAYHMDLSDNFERILNQLGLNYLAFSILGGGRIYHNNSARVIKIYGISEAYGKADHELAAEMIRQAYPNYTVSVVEDPDF